MFSFVYASSLDEVLKVVSVSVCLSVISCPDCIFYLFVLSGSNVSHTVPFTQVSALTLNHISRSKVKI